MARTRKELDSIIEIEHLKYLNSLYLGENRELLYKEYILRDLLEDIQTQIEKCPYCKKLVENIKEVINDR